MKHVIYLFFFLIPIISCNSDKKIKKRKPLEIKRENASVNAKRIMTDSFYYDTLDEFAPFGNNIGYDTYFLYSDWKQEHTEEDTRKFLLINLRDMDLQGFDLTLDGNDHNKLTSTVNGLPHQYLDLNFIDNTIISLAFSQLFIDGKIDERIKKMAKQAVKREIVFLDFWEEDAKRRSVILNKMMLDLEKIK